MTFPQPDLHPAFQNLPRPAGRADLFGCLDALGVAHATHEHPPIFTVEEGRDLKAALPGGHSKNLFLKSKRGELVLVSARDNTQVRLNRLHATLGLARLSFGSEELLWETLCVRPGSVTAFALMNDVAGAVRFVLDKALADEELVNFHPLENTATTTLASADLLRFVAATGRQALIVDLAAIGSGSGAEGDDAAE